MHFDFPKNSECIFLVFITCSLINCIEQLKFNNLKILNCYDNDQINNVNHVTDTLEKMICKDNCIDQKGVSQLHKLRYLNCSHNGYIIDINHMADTLEELYCRNRNLDLCCTSKLKS